MAVTGTLMGQLTSGFSGVAAEPGSQTPDSPAGAAVGHTSVQAHTLEANTSSRVLIWNQGLRLMNLNRLGCYQGCCLPGPVSKVVLTSTSNLNGVRHLTLLLCV